MSAQKSEKGRYLEGIEKLQTADMIIIYYIIQTEKEAERRQQYSM